MSKVLFGEKLVVSGVVAMRDLETSSGLLADCSGFSALWLPSGFSRSKGDLMSSLLPSGRALSSCSLRVVSAQVPSLSGKTATVPYNAVSLCHKKNSFSYPKMSVPPVICWDSDSVRDFFNTNLPATVHQALCRC